MITILTPTTKFVHPELTYSNRNKTIHCESEAEGLFECDYRAWRDEFIETPRKAAKVNVPAVLPVYDKPELQKAWDDASPENRKLFEKYNRLVQGAEAAKMNGLKINLEPDREIRRAGLKSRHTAKAYRKGTDRLFEYCKMRQTSPLFIQIKEAGESARYLRTNLSLTSPSRYGK
ncbi:MAG: hypothetical protein LBK13_03145 [Spirochaetales bacterium]|jgi:hypothetical protein|nr:hypothetical protein [Spirochaetales bacterium]